METLEAKQAASGSFQGDRDNGLCERPNVVASKGVVHLTDHAGLHVALTCENALALSQDLLANAAKACGQARLSSTQDLHQRRRFLRLPKHVPPTSSPGATANTRTVGLGEDPVAWVDDRINQLRSNGEDESAERWGRVADRIRVILASRLRRTEEV